VYWGRALKLTRAISLDTADYLERAIAIVDKHTDRDAIERATAMLGLEIAATDAHWHRELDELYDDMRVVTQGPMPVETPVRRPTSRFLRLKAAAGVGVTLALAANCGEEVETQGSTTSTTSNSSSSGEGGMVVDPAPGGMGGMAGEAGEGGMVVDPAPGGMGGMSSESGTGGMSSLEPGIHKHLPIIGQPLNSVAKTASKPRLIDQWFDTAPKAAVRSTDLPLFDPPQPSLRATRQSHEELHVRVECAAPITTRWEADGTVVGKGNEVTWRPRRDSDRIRVAVRSAGGVAVLSLQASEAKPAT